MATLDEILEQQRQQNVQPPGGQQAPLSTTPAPAAQRVQLGQSPFEDAIQSYVAAQQPRQIPQLAPMAPVVKEKSSFDILGTAAELGETLLRAPGEAIAATIDAFQGQEGVDVLDPDIFERFSTMVQESSRRSIEEATPGAERTVAELAPSLGFSLGSLAASGAASVGAGLGTGAVTGGTGAIPAAVAAGAAAGGTFAYRASSSQIMREFLNAKNDEVLAETGKPMTREQQESFKQQFSEKATEFGLWEAIPEAVGNVVMMKGLVSGPLKGLLKKTGLNTFTGRLAGEAAEEGAEEVVQAAGRTAKNTFLKRAGKFGVFEVAPETATEAVTEIGQSRTLAGTELGEETPLAWDAAGFVEATKRVLPQTLLLLGTTRTIAKGVTKLDEVARNHAETNKVLPQLKEQFPDMDLSVTPTGLVSFTVSEEVDGRATETTHKVPPRVAAAILRANQGNATREDQLRTEAYREELLQEAEIIEEEMASETITPEERGNLNQALDEVTEQVQALNKEAVPAPKGLSEMTPSELVERVAYLEQQSKNEMSAQAAKATTAELAQAKQLLEEQHPVRTSLAQVYEDAQPVATPQELRGAMDQLGQAFGVEIHFFESEQAAGDSQGAFLPNEPGRVYINKNAKQPALWVAGHEILHNIRATDEQTYLGVLNAAREYLGQEAVDAAAEGRGDEEGIANVIGTLITQKGFIEKLSQENPTLFQRFLDAVADTLNKIRQVFGSEVPPELQQFEDAAAELLAQYAENQQQQAVQEPVNTLTDQVAYDTLRERFPDMPEQTLKNASALVFRRDQALMQQGIDIRTWAEPMEDYTNPANPPKVMLVTSVVYQDGQPALLLVRKVSPEGMALGLAKNIRADRQRTFVLRDIYKAESETASAHGWTVEAVIKEGATDRTGRYFLEEYPNAEILYKVQVKGKETWEVRSVADTGTEAGVEGSATLEPIAERMFEQIYPEEVYANNTEHDIIRSRQEERLRELEAQAQADTAQRDTETSGDTAGDTLDRIGAEAGLTPEQQAFIDQLVKESRPTMESFQRWGRRGAKLTQANVDRLTEIFSSIESIKAFFGTQWQLKMRRLAPHLLKTVPLPFKEKMFSQYLPQLAEIYTRVRHYTALQNGLVTESQRLHDEMVSLADTPEKWDAINKVAALASLFQMDPSKPFSEQPWTDATWNAEGMPDVASDDKDNPRTLRQAYDEARAAWDKAGRMEGGRAVQKHYLKIIKDVRKLRQRERNNMLAHIQEIESTSPALAERLRREYDQSFNDLKGNYLPLSRSGKYIIQLVNEDGRLISSWHYKTPERAHLAYTALSADLPEGYQVLADIQPQFKAEDAAKEMPVGLRNDILSAAEQRFMGSLSPDASPQQVEAAKAAMEDYTSDVFDMWIRSMPEGSSMKNSVRRKGIKGFNPDMMQAYIQYVISHASNIAYAEEGRQINKLLMEAEGEAQAAKLDQDDAVFMKRIMIDDIRQHLDSARKSTTHPVAQMLGKMSLVWYLSSPSQLLIQISQLGVMTLPKITARYGAKGVNALSTAMKKAMTPKAYNPQAIHSMDVLWEQINAAVTQEMVTEGQRARERQDAGETLTPQEADMLRYADSRIGEPALTQEEREGMLENPQRFISMSDLPEDVRARIDGMATDRERKEYMHDLLALRMAESENLLDITLSHEALEVAEGRTGNSLLHKFSFFIREAELASRKAATLAAFDLARQDKKVEGFYAAFDYARMVNIDTLYDYSKEARPYVLRINSAAKVLTTFQVFRVSTMFKLIHLAQETFRRKPKNPTKAELEAYLTAKGEARRELAGILMSVGILGGVTGIPFIKTIMALVELAAEDEDEPFLTELDLRNALVDMVGGTAADAILYGMPTVFGADISRRVGMDSIFEPALEPPEWLEGAALANWWAAQMLGPAWGVFAGFVDGYSKAEKGDHVDAWIAMLPKVFKDPMKAYKLAADGVKDPRGRRLLEDGALNPAELALMAVGISPSELGTAQRQSIQLGTITTRIARRRSELASNFAKAIEAEDIGMREKALEDIREFNRKSPQFAIGASDLKAPIMASIKGDIGVMPLRDLLVARKYGLPEGPQ